MRDRMLAWLLMSPAAFLVAGVLDVLAFALGSLRARCAARARAGSGL